MLHSTVEIHTTYTMQWRVACLCGLQSITGVEWQVQPVAAALWRGHAFEAQREKTPSIDIE